MQIEVCKARIRARAAEIQRGRTRAELEIFTRLTKEREDKLLLRHAQQISKQEMVWAAEKRRYEQLLEEKNTHEAAAFTRLGELCFEAAAEKIRNYGNVKHDPEASAACCRLGRSRSPRAREAP